MKFLVVGLGNIGDEYAETRHNAGFLVVDYLAKKLGVEFQKSNFGAIAYGKYKARQIILLKPDTYMNLSGKSVAFWLKKENISIEKLVIITDDLAFPFGTIKMKSKGSDAGHNGLKSIQHELGTTEYTRIRFGISSNFPAGKQIDYVLGKWNDFEKKNLAPLLVHAAEAVLNFCFLGINDAMLKCNSTKKSLLISEPETDDDHKKPME